jgi:hypothetical protein
MAVADFCLVRTRPENARSRGVNELLAGLRRSSLVGASSRAEVLQTTPSVPPAIRHILQLPETLPPRPRRPVRLDSSGRRLPPGPPPPRSGFVRSRVVTATEYGAGACREHEHGGQVVSLPGAYVPGRGSLVDIALRQLAQDWVFQKSYNRYYLHGLPSRLRSALVKYVGIWHGEGVTVSDLKAILLPPPDNDDDHQRDVATFKSNNEDFYYLDLSGCVGRSINLTEIISLLFPQPPDIDPNDVQDSWDVAEPVAMPAELLPNITHLSLALTASHGTNLSWKQLLVLASKLQTLTHLSLAYWPEPSFTPNAKYSSVVSAQGHTVQYGGTGPYSHSLDDDWFEAVGILKTLSRRLYSLEYLDLTGCVAWFSALRRTADGHCIDWATHWGKISTLVLEQGESGRLETDGTGHSLASRAVEIATDVEKHIIMRRAGKGRFINVIKDLQAP